MAQFVPRAFDQAAGFVADPVTLLTAWASVLAYTFQLYFDFSGYSDMALGVARLFGVKLPMNFNSPLQSSSMVEFWGRWHITLTRFLTWHIYIPLVRHITRWRAATGRSVLRGGNSRIAAVLSLIGIPTLVTMAISGLWHGAGWHYVVWGVLHGCYLCINQTWRLFRPRIWSDQVSYDRVMKPLGFVLTFGCVVIALVFFRAESVTSALSILGAMAGSNGVLTYTIQSLHGLGITTPVDFLLWAQPAAPFIWIVGLFICTTFMPNSLQLLRRYQPALDFPSKGPAQSLETRSRISAATVQPNKARNHPALEIVISGWKKLRLLGQDGLSLSDDLSAVIIALLLVLGISGLGQGDAFLYGQF
jgi:alginate O-acetyltransferase complex protein AlgI